MMFFRMNELEHFITKYGSLPKEAMEDLVDQFKSQTVGKKDLLLVSGQICHQLYFVKKGCLRLYYIANGLEVTVWFSFENSSAVELSSFLSEAPSEYFLEAIEDSEVLALHKSALTHLYKQHPALHKIMRAFWEDVILNLLNRFTALQKDTAEKRYLDLMNQPIYLQRIPQKYLASYIGITPTSLSRIRRNIQSK